MNSDIEEVVFSTNINVLVNHLNYGNHLGYDSLLSILHEARIQWLKSMCGNYSEINIENGIGWLVKKVEVDYLSEAFHGDSLKISLQLSNIGKTKFDINHEIYNVTKEKLLARANITFVCFNFQTNKINRLPTIIKDKINPYCSRA